MRKPKLIVVTYYIGCDLLGQPLYVKHNVYLNTYTKKDEVRRLSYN